MAISPGEKGRADDFINESERDANPANDEGRVAKLESNGTIHEHFMRGLFGTGSDGDVTLDGTNTYGFLSKSGNTYTLTRDIQPDNLTIESGVTLVTDGYRIFVRNKIDGAGTLDWGTPNNGSDGVSDTDDPAGGSGGSQSGSGPLKNVAGVSGAAGSQTAGTGTPGDGSDGNGADPGLGSNGVPGGDGGDAGGSHPGSSGGSGGTVTDPFTVFPMYRFIVSLGADLRSDATLTYLLPQATGGGGGAGGDSSTGDASGSGGGSAASGGVLLLFARVWDGTFTIKSNGGNGGNGDDAIDDGAGGEVGGGGGGAGGNGGVAIVGYNEKKWTGSYDLAGGTGGAGGSGLGGASDGASGTDGVMGSSYEFEAINLV